MAEENRYSLEDDSLEQPAAVVVADSKNTNKSSKSSRFQSPRSRGRMISLALIGLAILLLLGGVGLSIGFSHKTTKPTTSITINTQSLDNGTLNKLTSQSAQGTTVQTQLTITPSTLFKSDATIQNNLTVKGTSDLLGSVATGSNLTVGGNLTVGRNTSVAGNLSVSGTITTGNLNVGVINLSTLTLSGNLSLGGHFITTGTVPTATAGVAIGNGNVTVTGNDSVGSVVINVGNSGTLNSGEIAIIRFHSKFTGTPIVQLTPANQDAASLPYYVVAASGFFSIRTVAAPAAGASYVFNFFVAQ